MQCWCLHFTPLTFSVLVPSLAAGSLAFPTLCCCPPHILSPSQLLWAIWAPLPTRGHFASPASTSNSWFSINRQKQDPPVTPKCKLCSPWSLCRAPAPCRRGRNSSTAGSYRPSPATTYSGLLVLAGIPGPHGADIGVGLTVTSTLGPVLSVSAMSGLSVSSGWCVPLFLPKSGSLFLCDPWILSVENVKAGQMAQTHPQTPAVWLWVNYLTSLGL